MLARPSVRQSTKCFSDFNEIWEVDSVDECYAMVWQMTRSKVKIIVTKVWQLPISKSITSANVYVDLIKRLTMNSDTPIQKFLEKFLKFIFVRRRVSAWPWNLGCYNESTSSPACGLFIYIKQKICVLSASVCVRYKVTSLVFYYLTHNTTICIALHWQFQMSA